MGCTSEKDVMCYELAQCGEEWARRAQCTVSSVIADLAPAI